MIVKWTLLDPDVKVSEILASIDVDKVSLCVVYGIIHSLIEILPFYGMFCGEVTSYVDGSNWKAFEATPSHVAVSVIDIYQLNCGSSFQKLTFLIVHAEKSLVSDEYLIYLPDTPHLTKTS